MKTRLSLSTHALIVNIWTVGFVVVCHPTWMEWMAPSAVVVSFLSVFLLSDKETK